MVHSLGMPLNSTDRFISTHSDTHYAVYLWQPNRSASGEDDPIESLEIWDISSPSSYVPPKAPSVDAKLADKNQGPKVIRHLSSSDLSFYNIRQKSTPIIRSLELDESHVYFVEEDHRWLVGPQASHNLPRLHKVKSTGIPLFIGPRWEDECGADGDLDLSFCERNTETERMFPQIAFKAQTKVNSTSPQIHDKLPAGGTQSVYVSSSIDQANDGRNFRISLSPKYSIDRRACHSVHGTALC